MGRAWPLSAPRPVTAFYRQSLSAATAPPSVAASKAAEWGKGLAFVFSSPPVRYSTSSSLPHRSVRAATFSVRQRNQGVSQQQQQLFLGQQGLHKQQQADRDHGRILYSSAESAHEQQKEHVPRIFPTVAPSKQVARGSALPAGGAAGAAAGGVVRLRRDTYSSSGKGRFHTRSSLPAYTGIGRADTNAYVRTISTGGTPDTQLLLGKTANSGRSTDDILSRFSPLSGEASRSFAVPRTTLVHRSSSSSAPIRARPSFVAFKSAASGEVDATAAGWAAAASQKRGENSNSRKNLRVSFASDVPTRGQQPRAATVLDGYAGEAEIVVGTDADASPSPTSAEERNFLQYGFGRTRPGAGRSGTGSLFSKAAIPANAAQSNGEPPASGWKLLWPSALRRGRSKEAVSERQTAAEVEKSLHLPLSSLIYPTPLRRCCSSSSAAAAAHGLADAQTTGGLHVTSSASKGAPAAPQSRGSAAAAAPSAAAIARGSSITWARGASPTQGAAQPGAHTEAKAGAALLGLQRFQRRLPLSRGNAAASVEQELQPRGAGESLADVQQLIRPTSTPRGSSSSAAAGGRSTDRDRQTLSRVGIPSSLLFESELLPSVSICTAQAERAAATATEELIFAAGGGAATAAAASSTSSSRFFWWRAEARATRTFSCSRGFAAAWHLSSKGKQNTELLLQQPDAQELRQQPEQDLRYRALQRQEELRLLQDRKTFYHQQREQQEERSQQRLHATGGVLLKKQERVCWRHARGADGSSEFYCQPQQSVREGREERGEKYGASAAEICGVSQDSLFNLTLSVRQERRSFYAAEQLAHRSACQESDCRAGQLAEQLQERLVFGSQDLPRQQKLNVQPDQLEGQRQQQQYVPLQSEKGSQQLQRGGSRALRAERLQQQLSVHRRVRSPQSASVARRAVPQDTWQHRDIRGSEDVLKPTSTILAEGSALYPSFKTPSGDHKKSPDLTRGASDAYVSLRQPARDHGVAPSWLTVRNVSAGQSVAGTDCYASAFEQQSFASSESAPFVGFSAPATCSGDGLLDAVSVGHADRLQPGAAESCGPHDRISSCQKPRRHTDKPPSFVGSRIAAAALLYRAAARPSSSSAIRTVDRQLHGEAGVAQPVVKERSLRSSAPTSVNSVAAVSRTREAWELRGSRASLGARAARTKSLAAVDGFQKDTPAAKGVRFAREALAGTADAERVAAASGARVTTASSSAAAPLVDAGAAETAGRAAAALSQQTSARNVRFGVPRGAASTAIELPTDEPLLTAQPPNRRRGDGGGQHQYAWEAEADQPQLQQQNQQAEEVHEQLQKVDLAQRRRPKAAEQQKEQSQEKSSVRSNSMTAAAAVVHTEGRRRSHRGQVSSTFSNRQSRPATASAAAPATAGSAEAGVAATTAGVSGGERQVFAQGGKKQQGGVAVPGGLARRAEDDVKHSVDWEETPVDGEEEERRSSDCHVPVKKENPNRSNSARFALRATASTPSTDSTAAIGKRISQPPAGTASVVSPRQKRRPALLQYMPLYRLSSSCCRSSQLRNVGNGYQDLLGPVRRSSQSSSTSRSGSSSSSSKSSTCSITSAQDSKAVRRSTGSATGAEGRCTDMRLSSSSSVTAAPRHLTTTEIPPPEEFVTPRATAERTVAVASLAAAFPKDSGDLDAGKGITTAEEPADGVPEALAAEEPCVVSGPVRRGSSKLHAVFSSVAAAVKRRSRIIAFTGSARKRKGHQSVSAANDPFGGTAASEGYSSTASPFDSRKPLAATGPPMQSRQVADASSASVSARATSLPRAVRATRTSAVVNPVAGDPSGEPPGAAMAAAPQRRQQAERSGAGGEEAAEGYERSEDTHQNAGLAGASPSVTRTGSAVKETEDDSGVLKCYSLPAEDETQGHMLVQPVELSTLQSLDSQNSSVLSCHSFSSSSPSEQNIEGGSPVASAGPASSWERQARAERWGEREQADQSRSTRKHGETRTAAENVNKGTGGGEPENTVGAAGEDEEVKKGGGSLAAAGDFDEMFGGSAAAAAAVPRSERKAAATVASVVRPGGDEDYLAEEEVEVEVVRRERKGSHQTRADERLHSLKAAVARRAKEAERAAERASATRAAAARAAADLAAAERLAAARAAQAEDAAERTGNAREALVRAAAAARKDLSPDGGEREEEEELDKTGDSGASEEGRKSSLGSLRRLSTASSAGSVAPVVVEAKGDRLVRGKPGSRSGARRRSQARAAPPAPHASEGERSRAAAASTAPTERTISRGEDGGPWSNKRSQSWSSLRSVSGLPVAAPEILGHTGDGGGEEELPLRASAAAVAAREAQGVAEAARGAEEAAAAAAKVANVRAKEAFAAERAAEEAEASVDAARAAAEYEVRRARPEQTLESDRSSDTLDGDVSDLKRYASEFLLEENTEEPDPGIGVGALTAAVVGGRGRDSPRRGSSSAHGPRRQRAPRKDGGPPAADDQQLEDPPDIRTATSVQRRGTQVRNSVRGEAPPQRRRSQVLSREEELAAIAGHAPELIEEEEDGAAALARRAVGQNQNRGGSRRFTLTQFADSDAAAAPTVGYIAAGAVAGSVGADAAAAAAGAAYGIPAPTADAADADAAAAAAQRANTMFRLSNQTVEQREHEILRGREEKRETERVAAVSEAKEEEEEGEAAATHPDLTRQAMGPYRHHRQSRSMSAHERERLRRRSTRDSRDNRVASVGTGAVGPDGRRLSAAEGPSRQSWTSLAQLRKEQRADDRPLREQYRVAEAARRTREIEAGLNREEHDRELYRRRSLHEKQLVKRLLRHRTLQSPLLTVPPPLELQGSPVLQAVYSRGGQGAAEAVERMNGGADEGT